MELEPGYVLAGAPSVAVVQGDILLRMGALKSFEWKESGETLHVHFEERGEEFLVRMRWGAEEGLSIACTCFPGGKVCRHAVAAVQGIQAVVKGKFPASSLFTDSTVWEELAAQFLGEKVAMVEPDTLLAHIVVDFDAVSRQRLRFSRIGDRSDFYRSVTPAELERITLMWLPMEDREAAFANWLGDKKGSIYGVKVVRDGEAEEVRKAPPVFLEAEVEADLRGGLPVVRRNFRLAEEGTAVEVVACVYERLFYLTDGRFGWLTEERGEELWEQAQKVLEVEAWFGQRAETSEIGFSGEAWNDGNFRSPSRGADFSVLVEGEPVKAIPEEPVRMALRVKEQGEEVSIFPVFEARGVLLNPAEAIIAWAGQILEEQPRTFLNSAERRSIILRAAYAVFLSTTEKERNAILAETRKEPAIARIKAGKRIAGFALRNVMEMRKGFPKVTLHVDAGGGEASWFQVREGFAAGAALGALVVNAVPGVEARTGGFFSVAAKDFHPHLPALFAACNRAGIDFSLNEEKVEPIKLDFLVRAEREAGDLDWFALSPEVLADGSVIPQEKWDQLMSGSLLREEGKLRVVDMESAATLSKLREVLRLQAAENAGRKKTRNEPLRVSRLRMFDWLELRKAGVRCVLPPEEAEVLEALASFEGIPERPVPKGLQATMRPYQKEGYEWLAFLYRNRFGACLADDMGLGKTLQTIALLAGIREGFVERVEGGRKKKGRLAHLVVLPPTLLFNWRHEIETFYPDLKVEEYTGAQRDLDALKADVVLTTYELARRDIGDLEKREFDVIVFDEAQAIKNLAGERSKAMRRLKGRFKVCLTGTPLENHAGEYYSILELALPGIFGDYRRFMKSLNGEGISLIDRARPFVLRRTKEKILKELPAKVESDIWLDLTETQKTFYTRAVAEVREEVFRAFKDKTAQQAGIVALAALTRLRQICISPALIDPEQTEISPKIEYLLGKMVELGEEGHAALVFSQFTKTLDLVERHLAEAEIGFLRMDGTTPQAKRKEQVGAFQKGSGPGVFLISLKTGGVGLNLTRASYVFHLDPWWNPAVENQASDRAHRIGQKQRVFVNRILMRHTVEEKMMLLKERKQALFEQVFSGAENRTGSGLLTREDMAWLLE